MGYAPNFRKETRFGFLNSKVSWNITPGKFSLVTFSIHSLSLDDSVPFSPDMKIPGYSIV